MSQFPKNDLSLVLLTVFTNAVFGHMNLIDAIINVFSCSGKPHDETMLAKLESIYTGSGDQGSTMVSLIPLLVHLPLLFSVPNSICIFIPVCV
jgi:hypothetical protein